MTYTRAVKNTGKILLYILVCVVVLLCLVFIFINMPAGKRFIKNKAQSYLQDKLKTKVVLGSVNYSLPNSVEINNVYIEDREKDTLLYGERIFAEVSMFKLIWGITDVKQLALKNIFLHVNRAEKDTFFNYQYIIDAFTVSNPTSVKDTSALKIHLDKLVLNHISIRFADKNGGTDFTASINNLDASFHKFQPDRVDFGINDFIASGVNFFMRTYKEKILQPYLPVPADKISEPGYGLHITASTFNVRDVNVKIENSISGMYYSNQVTHLGLGKAVFNLSGSVATASEFLLDSSMVQYTGAKSTVSTGTKELPGDVTPMPWQIHIKQVSLNNNKLKYDDRNLPEKGGFDAGHFNLTKLTTDISSFTYTANKTEAFVKQLTFKDNSGFALDTVHVNFLMTKSILSAKELYIKTPQTLLQDFIEIKFDSIAGITKDPRNSQVAATLKNSTIAFNDLYLLVPALKKTFPPAQFANNRVVFNTELRGNLARIYLPYLQLTGLSGSALKAHGTLYNLTDADKFSYDLFIDQSRIRKTDILKFVPAENQQSLANLPEIMNVRGRFAGNSENLVSDINASGQGMAFKGQFTLNNITIAAKRRYDFVIRESSLDKSFILGLVPPGTLPPEINLPEKNYIKGTLKGTIDNMVADLQLGGSYGLLTVKGFIKDPTDKERATYDLFITTNHYEIGKLISQDSIYGKVTGSFTAKGTGFNYKTMRSDITASVKQLQYNKYNYQNATITANLNNGIIDSKGMIDDDNLKLQYDLKANVQKEYPSVNGLVRIDTAKLQPLNLYTDTLNFSLTANISANSLQPRSLDIHTIIDSVRLQVAKGFYKLDSVSVIATSANGKDSINFYAPFANLQVSGAFDYDQVGDAIVQYVNHYYHISDSVSAGTIPGQQMVFAGTVNKHPLLTGIIPGLKDYDAVSFNGSFVSANTDSALNLHATIPYLAYQDRSVRNGRMDVLSKNERINYDVKFDTLHTATGIFYATRFNGSAAHDSIMINALTQDDKAKDWFGVKASLTEKENNYSFRLKDSLLLNYEKWNVASDNYISYSPQGLIIHHFVLTSDTSRISISSRQEIVNSPIDILIDHFNLKSISSILNHDTVFVSGVMDAKMEVSELDKKIPAFTGTMTVTDLALLQQPVGLLTATASKQSENNITATLTLQGNHNDIAAKGNYYLDDETQDFDASVIVKQLNLASLQGFTFGGIRNSTGNVSGNMNIQGKFSDPRWKGELNFDTTKFTITQLNTPFKINRQKIEFDYPAVNFHDFIVLDSLDKKMKIDGSVSVNKEKSFDLKLKINASDFMLLNAPKAINNEFYGIAVADADITINGNSVSPDIEGNILVKDKSNIVIIVPEKSYGKDEGRTIVRFIDRDTFDINPPAIPFVEEKEAQSNFAQFLNYNLNIEMHKKAALTIIIDPVTGDEINVQGEATLNAGVDPGGHIILAGNYELDKGYYVFNYQFLQRKFILEKGSQITFAGEPLQSRLNVTAVYTVNTSAKDLLGNEVGSVDPLLANSFNQKIPFKVVLYLTGPVSKPIIKFDLQLPEENTVINSDLRTTIEHKLTQIRGDEAATNKQVFSLLLLGRFVSEQSSDFFKGNGNDFTDLARQSVSRFLSSALNEIAGNILKGVDIDLNLNSYTDYSNGGSAQRTDLNVAISKTFLNDRLTVGIGKNFGVLGQDAVSKANNSFIPDVTIGYKLTGDGKYLLKAYRKNQFEVVLDGYVVETGMGFVVTLSYDQFNELFRNRRKK